MKIFKSKRKQPKPDVWVSEIRLRACGPKRLAKVKKLLALLDKEGFDAGVS